MRFYYISLFSLIVLGLIYVFGTMFLVWLGKILKKRWDGAWKVMVPLFLMLYIGPIAEELWIAWNFGQLCKKDAGIAITKTVEVEGFYDSTMRTAYENIKSGGYRFMEHATADRKGVERVERASADLRKEALAWFTKNYPGKARSKERAILYSLNDKETIVVSMNGIDAWHVTKLDQPSARHHYSKDAGKRVNHKIVRQTSSVVNAQTDEVMGSYVRYSRKAPWFFIGLDRPGFGCDGPDGGPYTQRSFLIYRDILIPSKSNAETQK